MREDCCQEWLKSLVVKMQNVSKIAFSLTLVSDRQTSPVVMLSVCR